jgi:hypothetical protein|tara:strand:- start:563 stop:772 length:210 start_codon:yes stop_codon:yes gene_type:complete
MTLEEYRLTRNLSYGQLAKLLGAKYPKMAQRWCLPFHDPERQIPVKYMDAIVRVTNGAVMPNDFFMERM